MARHAVVRSSLLSPPSYYEAVHDGRGPSSPQYPFLSGWYHYMDQEPHSGKRRGGIVDQRDVIMAHQAHKIHNTPQAKRKEWDAAYWKSRQSASPWSKANSGDKNHSEV